MTTARPGSDPAFLAAYGSAVARHRKEQGLSRKQLAARAGISYSYLSAIESGQKLPSLDVQEALADTLRTTPAALLADANRAADTTQAFEMPAVAAAPPAAAPSAGEPRRRTMRLGTRRADADGVETAAAISASGALAELQAIVPTLAPEDAAVLVTMARRLAAAPDRPADPVRSLKGSAQRDLRTAAYLSFWAEYLDGLETRGLDWARGRLPEPRSYFTTRSPIKGASLSASFARNRKLRHELYINRGSRDANLELLRDLEGHRELLESAYGAALDFEDPGQERRAVRIADYREGHISQRDEHGDYIAWFIDRGIRMRAAIDAYLTATRRP